MFEFCSNHHPVDDNFYRYVICYKCLSYNHFLIALTLEQIHSSIRNDVIHWKYSQKHINLVNDRQNNTFRTQPSQRIGDVFSRTDVKPPKPAPRQTTRINKGISLNARGARYGWVIVVHYIMVVLAIGALWLH